MGSQLGGSMFEEVLCMQRVELIENDIHVEQQSSIFCRGSTHLADAGLMLDETLKGCALTGFFCNICAKSTMRKKTQFLPLRMDFLAPERSDVHKPVLLAVQAKRLFLRNVHL